MVKKIPHYRKTIVSRCKQLRYLDDRPVFEDERRRVDAWAEGFRIGGTLETAQEAERLEILKIRKEKDEVDERNFRFFEQMMQDGIRERRRLENNDVLSNATEDDQFNSFSGFDFTFRFHIVKLNKIKYNLIKLHFALMITVHRRTDFACFGIGGTTRGSRTTLGNKSSTTT